VNREASRPARQPSRMPAARPASRRSGSQAKESAHGTGYCGQGGDRLWRQQEGGPGLRAGRQGRGGVQQRAQRRRAARDGPAGRRRRETGGPADEIAEHSRQRERRHRQDEVVGSLRASTCGSPFLGRYPPRKRPQGRASERFLRMPGWNRSAGHAVTGAAIEKADGHNHEIEQHPRSKRVLINPSTAESFIQP
jgi:hypothetical protein